MTNPESQPSSNILPGILVVGGLVTAASLLLFGPLDEEVAAQDTPENMALPIPQAEVAPPPQFASLGKTRCRAPETVYRGGLHLYRMPAGCSTLRVSIWSSAAADRPAMAMQLTDVVYRQYFSLLIDQGEVSRTSVATPGSRDHIMWIDANGSGTRNPNDQTFGYTMSETLTTPPGDADLASGFIRLQPGD